jgi:hypothetical protein
MKMFEMFKEENGLWSARRVIAFISLFMAFALAFFEIFYRVEANLYHVLLPLVFGLICVLMLFFTTWADIKEIIAAVKK